MAAGDYIDPEVYADLAQASFTGKVKVLGSPLVKDDNTLVGTPGSTITFPKWGALGELTDLTKGTAIVPAQMEQTSTTATVKEVGGGVYIDDADKLTMLGGSGAAESEAVRQFGVLAARKVDGDLITEATDNAGLAVTTTQTAFNWQALVDGFAKFGDEFEVDEFAGVYINSAQMAEAFADDQFINASKIGDNSVVRRGVIGVIGGLPVYVSDRITAGKILIGKKQSLGALYKRRPVVEQDRDILKRQDVYTTNVHYAVKAINANGLCVVTLTV